MARLEHEEGRNMAAAFNPYRVWLGVASETSPPSHYELLGIAPANASAETVAEAFRRQMTRLNPHLEGEHGAIAKKVAAELANARVVLLTPTTKRAYDAELTSRSKSAPAGSAATVQRPQPKPQAPSLSGSSADALLPPAAGPMPAAAPEPKASLVTPPAASMAPVTAPLNQPLPPTAVPGAYPGMAPGQVHPQAYGQPYAPAYGAAPQAAPAYSYGQPYPAPVQPFPGQPAYAAQPAPLYPAAAPAAATLEPPQDPALSSLPSGPSSPLQRTAGRKRSSAAPMLAGLTVAAAVVVGGVVYMVKSDSATQTVADNSGPQRSAAPQPAAPAPRPAAGGDAVSTPQSSGERRQPRVVAPSKEPIVAPKIIAENASDDAGGDGSEKKPSMADGPEPMTEKPKRREEPSPEMKPEMKPNGEGAEKPKPEAMKPEAPNPEEKSAASSAAKPVAPDSPEEPPEDKAAIEKALNAARKALADRDLDEAEVLLAQATLEATSRESLAKVDRVQALATRVGEFWNAVRQMLPKLEAGESFEVEGDEVNVVEASAELIVVRVAGKNREYPVAKIPAKLAMTLATRWLDKDSAVTPAVLGAFQAVDPKGDRQQARLYFQQARAGGLDVSPLIAELDAMEKASEK